MATLIFLYFTSSSEDGTRMTAVIRTATVLIYYKIYVQDWPDDASDAVNCGNKWKVMTKKGNEPIYHKWPINNKIDIIFKRHAAFGLVQIRFSFGNVTENCWVYSGHESELYLKIENCYVVGKSAHRLSFCNIWNIVT